MLDRSEFEGDGAGLVQIERRTARNTARSGVAWAVLLILAMLLVPIVQLVVGVSMTGMDRAHDGPFTVFTLVQFQDELRAGDLLPRWAVAGYDGLGSPIFFFYPPGAYLAAAVLGIILPGVPAAGIIGVAQVLLRILATLTCFAWLRRLTTMQAALTGSALFGLMPWVSITNPQVRLDFAECAAAALVPLVFLATDAGRGQVWRTIMLVAAAMCALTFVHLPTTVATGGLAVVYAAASGNTWRAGLGRATATTAGILLGLGLAACYVLPAISLLPEISTSALWDAHHQPEGHFILGLNTFHRSSMLVNAGLLVPGGLVVLVCGGAIIAARREHGGGGSRWRWDRARGPRLAVAATFALAAFMAMPISAPVWSVLTPLRLVQFPGRFLMPASLLASGLIAIVLPSCRPALRFAALAVGFALSAAAIVLVIRFGDGMSASRTRTQQALADPLANAPEYVPAQAGARGWLNFAQNGGDVHARAARLVSPCVEKPLRSGEKRLAPLTFDLEGCSGPTVLPQFYFTGWVAKAGGQVLPAVQEDPASGLVRIDVPPHTKTITLHRTWLRVEWLGALVSSICLALWLAVLCVARPRGRQGLRASARRYPAPARRQSAPGPVS